MSANLPPLTPHPSLTDAQRLLEGSGADQFELFFQRKSATKIESKNQRIETLSQAEDMGLAIRVLKDQRPGFSFTTSLAPEAIERAVRSAMELTQIQPPEPDRVLPHFSNALYPSVDLLDAKGLAISVKEKADLAKRLEAECRAQDPRITAIRSASVSESLFEVQMVDGQGEWIGHRGTMFGASITCKAEAGGESQMGSDFGFSNFYDQLDVTAIAKEATRTAVELLGAGRPDTIKCPAILRNSVVAELLEFLAPSFSAEEIEKGRSMLAGKQGERVFAESITLVNDGLLAGGYATSPFDGEGCPSRRISVIEGGFFQTPLYDHRLALKAGTTSSGCAGRGLKAPPEIGITNFFLPAGKKSAAQLFDGITRGILLTDLMGVHTANPVTGDFSLGASGILIENGKLTRPVRGFAVAGNILGLLRSVTDVASDLRFFGSVGAPSVRISEISVGGS